MQKKKEKKKVKLPLQPLLSTMVQEQSFEASLPETVLMVTFKQSHPVRAQNKLCKDLACSPKYSNMNYLEGTAD